MARCILEERGYQAEFEGKKTSKKEKKLLATIAGTKISEYHTSEIETCYSRYF